MKIFNQQQKNIPGLGSYWTLKTVGGVLAGLLLVIFADLLIRSGMSTDKITSILFYGFGALLILAIVLYIIEWKKFLESNAPATKNGKRVIIKTLVFIGLLYLAIICYRIFLQ